MNWLQKMREGQRAIAARFSSSFADEFFPNKESRQALEEELTIGLTQVLEKLSWSIAKKVFANPDFGRRKNAKTVLKEMILDFDMEAFVQEAIDPDLTGSLRAVATGLVRGVFEGLAGGEYRLPDVGKLVRRDGHTCLVLDRRGLKKIKKLMEAEAELDREAKACAKNKPAPGMTSLGDITFDDGD